MRGKSENRKLTLFFSVTFMWSWFFWMPQIWGFNFYVAPFGPFVAAFLLTYLQEDYEGVKKLLIKGFDPRIRKTWYISTFFFWPALVSSLVLGVIWAVWHLPLNFMYWLGPQCEVGLAMFTSTVVLFTFVFMLIIFSSIWKKNVREKNIFLKPKISGVSYFG